MNNSPPIPYERMNVNELIREAEHSENKLALRLVDCFEEATDLEIALSDLEIALSESLTRGYENLRESLQGLTVVLTEEVFDVDSIAESICDAVEAECDDEGLPAGLAESINKILARERQLFEELVAEAFPKWLLNDREHDALTKEIKASTAGIAFIDVPNPTDFDNPFPAVLEAKRKKDEEEKQRQKEMRKQANAQKTANRKSPKGN